MQAGSGRKKPQTHKALSRDCDNGHHSTGAIAGVFLRLGCIMLVLDTVIKNFNSESQSLDKACLADNFSKASCTPLGFCARAAEAPLTFKG